MQSGVIRINKIKEDFHDLSDYWQLSMHDNINDFIPKMCFSYDEHYFFSCGYDGNIFSYKYYPEGENYKIPNVVREKLVKETLHIDDDEQCYDNLSLQQAIVKAELDRINKVANDHKNTYRFKLSKLKTEFDIILKRNTRLLFSQIIPSDELVLDLRITADLDSKLKKELELVKRKLAFDVQKSEIRLNKLMNYFINPLGYFPICVSTVRNVKIISTLRQNKLQEEFYLMKKVIDEKIIEEDLKGRYITY